MHALIHLREAIFCLRRETRGAVATEYAFLIAFIAIVSAAGMFALGNGLLDYFNALGGAIAGAADQDPS